MFEDAHDDVRNTLQCVTSEHEGKEQTPDFIVGRPSTR